MKDEKVLTEWYNEYSGKMHEALSKKFELDAEGQAVLAESLSKVGVDYKQQYYESEIRRIRGRRESLEVQESLIREAMANSATATIMEDTNGSIEDSAE